MTKVLKGASFKWTPNVQQESTKIKEILNQSLELALPCFDKVFEMQWDDSRVRIGRALV